MLRMTSLGVLKVLVILSGVQRQSKDARASAAS
jgi:hypothetical protein